MPTGSGNNVILEKLDAMERKVDAQGSQILEGIHDASAAAEERLNALGEQIEDGTNDGRVREVDELEIELDSIEDVALGSGGFGSVHRAMYVAPAF